jgi:hypothetical protein
LVDHHSKPAIGSQEMRQLFLRETLDPLDYLGQEAVENWKNYHPALYYLTKNIDFEFAWPKIIDINKYFNSDEPSLGENVISLNIKNSPLGILGYKVGAGSTLTTNARRQTLKEAFLRELPAIESVPGWEAYMKQWGKPKAPRRLWRIAKHLHAQLTLKRPLRSMEHAINDWKSDLIWLQNTFYKKLKFRFAWPK